MNKLTFTLALVASLFATPSQAKLLDGASSYTPPSSDLEVKNSREFQTSFDATWRAVVAHLADTSFVIDTIDKDSGLITISFSISDPSTAIDCGHWTTWVKNMRGRRDYSYDGAAPRAQYEVLEKSTLANIERSVSLSGKFNILVTSTRTDASRVKVTTRYVPSISLRVSPLAFDSNFQRVGPRTFTESMNFNTSSEAQVPGGQTVCRANGTLEAGVLDGIGATIGT